MHSGQIARWSRNAVLSALCTLSLTSCPVPTSPIARALHYLIVRQVNAPNDQLPDSPGVVDYTGDWPQYFAFHRSPRARTREVSPFTVAFIHESLSMIAADTAAQLGLTQTDASAAHRARQKALACMERFAAHPNAPDAGAYGFWPYAAADTGDPVLEQVFLSQLVGPRLGGERGPANLPSYPRALSIPSDADVTAAVYAARLRAATIDNGPPVDTGFIHLFTDWRDQGLVPRRNNPDWLPSASGAFLTWLSYHDPPDDTLPNDVDLVVNANVLHTLAQYGVLDAPGEMETVALLNQVVQQGLHRTAHDTITLYYPDNYAFEYAVSRAYQGGQIGLEPAVHTLVQEIKADALIAPDGTAHWDRGSPTLNTAFALLTLLNAAEEGPLPDQAAAYLVATQRPLGNWDAGVFFIAHTDGGQRIDWRSSAFTTAMCLQALCRYELTRAG